MRTDGRCRDALRTTARHGRAMTLVELVVALVVLSVLATMAVVGGLEVYRSSVDGSRQDSLRVLQFAQESNMRSRGSFLDAESLARLEPGYSYTEGAVAGPGQYSVQVSASGGEARMATLGTGGSCLTLEVSDPRLGVAATEGRFQPSAQRPCSAGAGQGVGSPW